MILETRPKSTLLQTSKVSQPNFTKSTSSLTAEARKNYMEMI